MKVEVCPCKRWTYKRKGFFRLRTTFAYRVLDCICLLLGPRKPTKRVINVILDGHPGGAAAPCRNPGVLSLSWYLSLGRSQRNCKSAIAEYNPGPPLPMSLWWLECVDNELLALAVKISLSLSYQTLFRSGLSYWSPSCLLCT
jgi:hypothetical protein